MAQEQKELTKEQKQEQKQIKAYIEDIKKNDKKHGLSLRAILKYEESGVTPAFTIIRQAPEKETKKK